MQNQLSRTITVFILLAAAVGILIAAINFGKQDQAGPPVTGTPAPAISLLNLDGKTVSLSDLKGKVVLINFWGSWCDPCREEMPNIQRVYDQWKDKGFTVIGVNIGESLVTAKGFADRLQLTFPIVLDQDRTITTDIYHIGPIPTSFFIDKNGVVQATFTGPMTISYMNEKIQTLLAQ